MKPTYEELEEKLASVVAENAGLISSSECLLYEASEVYRAYNKTQLPDGDLVDEQCLQGVYDAINATPATDRFIADVTAKGRIEGINFAAGRLAAAYNHGFVDKPLAEAFDVVRMILSAKEDLAYDPLPADDGLSGEYAEQSLKDWEQQLRGEEKA